MPGVPKDEMTEYYRVPGVPKAEMADYARVRGVLKAEMDEYYQVASTWSTKSLNELLASTLGTIG